MPVSAGMTGTCEELPSALMRPAGTRESWLARGAAAVTLLILAGPILAGLIGVLLPAFGHLPAIGRFGPSLQPWRDLLSMPGIFRSAILSLTAGLVTGAISLIVVILLLAGALGTRTFAIIRRLISPLLSVPHAAAAFGLAFLIAPSGWIVRLLSPWATGFHDPPDWLTVNDPNGFAMIAGLVLKEVPFLLLIALAALPQLQPDRRLAVARSLGYGRATGFLKAVAPLLYPLIRLPLYAVIAYSTAVVDVAMILGPANPPALSVAVVKWMADPDLNLRLVASAGALLQVGVTVSTLLIWRFAEAAFRRLAAHPLIDGRRRFGDPWLGRLGIGLSILIVIASVLGMLSLAVWSVAGLWRFPDWAPQSIDLVRWGRAFPLLSGPIWTSVLVGLLSTVLSVLLVIAALENELLHGRPAEPFALVILYAPLLVPPVGFLFGLTVAADAAGLGPTLPLVVLGHLLFVLPYIYLSLSEAYRRFDPRFALAAATLGAAPTRQFFEIRLPILLQPILTAAAVGFAVSIGQYLATQLLGAGRVTTITTEAVALAAGGDRRIIGIYALAQALIPAAGFLIALTVPRLVWHNRRALRGN